MFVENSAADRADAGMVRLVIGYFSDSPVRRTGEGGGHQTRDDNAARLQLKNNALASDGWCFHLEPAFRDKMVKSTRAIGSPYYALVTKRIELLWSESSSKELQILRQLAPQHVAFE